MTLSLADLLLYAGALFVLFLTPGPVWLALGARALSGGFHAAWPLALGVVVGDVIWPFLAVLGVSWIVGTYGSVMVALRYVAALMFACMGAFLILNADKTISADSRLTRPGKWAGFIAGLAVIFGNPKAILFYMGLLPGFFDLTAVTRFDIIAICAISAAVPLVGNLIMAGMIGHLRGAMTSPRALYRTNLVAGALMLCVAVIIPFA